MGQDYVEYAEVAGKTVKALRIYEDAQDGCETLIEFTDGTSFSCSVGHKPTIKTALFKGGVGTPQIIHAYEV
jgi:hypothetical protein